VELVKLVHVCRVAGTPGVLPPRHAREVLGFCNRPAIDTCIVDNVRGARVTRWCPMNGGERIDDRLVG
jgi:hypothetical protein